MKTHKLMPGVHFLKEVLQDSFSKIPSFRQNTQNIAASKFRSQNEHKPSAIQQLSLTRNASNKSTTNLPPSAADNVGKQQQQQQQQQQPINNQLESTLIDWMKPNEDSNQSEKEAIVSIVPKDSVESGKSKVKLSRSAVEKRCKQLVFSLKSNSAPVSQALRLQEICRHLLNYPDSNGLMTDFGAVPILLRLSHLSPDKTVANYARQALAMLGHCGPPKGDGIRILSIDGGGSRGIVVLEILKKIESMTKEPIWKSFDLICGVSAGSMIAMLVGALQKSLDQCDKVYKKFTTEMFQRDIWGGTQRLLWTHAYYDTKRWNAILRQVFSEKMLIETSQTKGVPKVLAISAVVNTPSILPFVFRNYHPPDRWYRDYEGSCEYKIWEAIRASSAAPGYFEEFALGQYVHQDGGILMNNPTAVAIHEAQLLWPNEQIQCCISIGTGKYSPLTPLKDDSKTITSTSLRTKITRLIDSATDTEGVHRLLQDLVRPDVYFRFNPTLSDYWHMDENRPEKIEQMRTDTQMYLRKNEYKLKLAIKSLSRKRSTMKSVKDWLSLQYLLRK
ncbi:calcium-independent phospholipase A2-gamma-like protein [Dinothrombium tinctorium]|uniref:Calcium-independent phospholipase A2-gamma-like protein n=1 Tax=Dinothrombium tinctorium TaxID=1965070 RepID=A0A3S3PDQ9_9ACAR|nr:calcium-independent phospholipase A2-gamma-like protein [Dinothrombium tinctorium]